MTDTDYTSALQGTIDTIAENFFIDPEVRKVGDREVRHWNTTILGLAYVLDSNVLLMGEPGFAKTTAAKVVSSIMSGYPFDLYEAAQIQGHPDQTYETMLARLDFSKMNTEESVIWLLSAYLPVKIIDELNRLPAGNQDELLNTLQTGRFNYLNSTFYTGVTPFIATANHPDDGNHVLIPPMRDRFATHLEIGHIGSTYRGDIKRAKDNIKELCSSDITGKIVDIINDKSKTVKQRMELIDSARKEFADVVESDDIGGTVFTREKVNQIQEQVKSIPLDDHAEMFLQTLESELNYTPTFGRKRSNDKRDTSNHAEGLASTRVMNAMSPRAGIDGIEYLAQGLALLEGAENVEKRHIVAVAPHALGHRLEFETGFMAEHEGKPRGGMFGMPRETYLAQKLVEHVDGNYETVKTEVDLLRNALGHILKDRNMEPLSDNQWDKVHELIGDQDSIDHPLIKEYAHRIGNDSRYKKPK